MAKSVCMRCKGRINFMQIPCSEPASVISIGNSSCSKPSSKPLDFSTANANADKLHTGKWGITEVNPEAWPRGLQGMKAVRFDHCLFYGPELAAVYDIFVNVLGFHLAEQVLDPEGTRIAQFLTVSMKEHDIAFIHHEEKGKFHHASFFLETWEDVLRAADLITMTDTSIDIGPTRHGLTHGKTIYFFDPSGNRNEVFCGGDYTYPDHKPVTWTADELGKAIFYHDRQLNERFLTVLT